MRLPAKLRLWPRLAWALLALTLGVTAAAFGCSSDEGTPVPGASTLAEATQSGEYGVGVTTLDLVDASRETPAHAGYGGSPVRRLRTEVWYPARSGAAQPEARDAELEESGAPYPLIIFGHGLPALRRQSASYARHLASHGYIVASPTFPLTNLGAPGGPYFLDVVNQPGDVSFIIDQFEVFEHDEGTRFFRSVDLASVGMTGHSFGGITALMSAYGQLRDDRLKAILPIAAPGCFLPSLDLGDALPVLILGGSEDLFVGRANVRTSFEAVPAPRYFVEIQGADHTRFSDADVEDTVIRPLFGSLVRDDDLSDDAEAAADIIGADLSRCEADEDPAGVPLITADRQRELLRAFATPFFDAYLKHSDEARSFLEGELGQLAPEAVFEAVPE